jgi:purine-binding chemotaxis protein CheW
VSTATTTTPDASTTVPDPRYCTFRLGELFVGIPVMRVQEVIRDQERTRVPLVNAAVHGLINLRGGIVTVIDLHHLFGLGARVVDSDPIHIVVRTDDGVVSLLADQVGDVIEVDAAEHEALPPTLAGRTRELCRGVYKVADQLMLVLDLDAVLDCAS